MMFKVFREDLIPIIRFWLIQNRMWERNSGQYNLMLLKINGRFFLIVWISVKNLLDRKSRQRLPTLLGQKTPIYWLLLV